MRFHINGRAGKQEAARHEMFHHYEQQEPRPVNWPIPAKEKLRATARVQTHGEVVQNLVEIAENSCENSLGTNHSVGSAGRSLAARAVRSVRWLSASLGGHRSCNKVKLVKAGSRASSCRFGTA